MHAWDIHGKASRIYLRRPPVELKPAPPLDESGALGPPLELRAPVVAMRPRSVDEAVSCAADRGGDIELAAPPRSCSHGASPRALVKTGAGDVEDIGAGEEA